MLLSDRADAAPPEESVDEPAGERDAIAP